MADEEDSSSSGSDLDLNEDEEDIEEPVPESWLGYSWYVVKKAGKKTHKGEKISLCTLLLIEIRTAHSSFNRVSLFILQL